MARKGNQRKEGLLMRKSAVILVVFISLLAFQSDVPRVFASPDLPSTVGTTDICESVHAVWQIQSFEAEGRFWYFYANGSIDDIVYKTSLDGETWSAHTVVKVASYATGRKFSLWYDGTYVDWVYSIESDGEAFTYRRGTPQSDGTITWSASEQTVRAGVANNKYMMISVAIDSDGYPWAYYQHRVLDGSWVTTPYVIKSDNNDGTWSGSETPFQLNTTHSNDWIGTVLPLTDGKVYVVYGQYGVATCGRLYNGGWGSEETIISATISWDQSVIASVDGDDIVYTGQLSSNKSLRYLKRTYGVGWGSQVPVYDASNKIYPAISVATNGSYYIFWKANTADPTAHHMFYKRSDDDGVTWSDTVDWIDETVDEFTGECWAFVIEKVQYGDYITVQYQTDTPSPYKLRFAALYVPSNSDPINDASSFIDLETGNRALSMSQYYNLDVNVTEVDGSDDIDYIEIRFETSVGVFGASIRWTESTDTFTVQTGDDYIDESGSTNETSGNVVMLHIKVRYDWDYPFTSVADVQVYSIDDSAGADTDTYSNLFQVVETLVFSGQVTDQSTYDQGAAMEFTGTLYYTGTMTAPPNGDYGVLVLLDAVTQGTDNTLVSGIYSITATAPSSSGSFTYTSEATRVSGSVSYAAVSINPTVAEEVATSVRSSATVLAQFLLIIVIFFGVAAVTGTMSIKDLLAYVILIAVLLIFASVIEGF